MSIELPVRDPCEVCDGLAGREDRYVMIDERKHTATVVSPCQDEIGQCLVAARRHGGILFDLSGGFRAREC